MMRKVTVFTPTYNRANMLGKLYDSLVSQTNKDFVWLIVDDGSTDDTKVLIEEFQRENKIEINYIYQKNGGKHVAHNTGVLACETDIFYCVDSDDYLSDDCVDVILKNWDEVEADDTLAGIIALKENLNENRVITHMPEGIKKTSIYNLYYRHGFKGEAAIIFKTSIIKKFLFPVFENERFVTESAVYDLISRDYKMLLLNHVIYFHKYFEDGYTANIHKVHLNNPEGYSFFLRQRIGVVKSKKDYKIAVCDYLSGMIMIKRNPFKNKPVSTTDMLKSVPCAGIKLTKIFIKSIILNRIN